MRKAHYHLRAILCSNYNSNSTSEFDIKKLIRVCGLVFLVETRGFAPAYLPCGKHCANVVCLRSERAYHAWADRQFTGLSLYRPFESLNFSRLNKKTTVFGCFLFNGGGRGIRTLDLLTASQAL